MNIGDIVVPSASLGKIVGKSTDGRWIVEWTYNEIDPYDENELFLIEEKKEEDGLPSEN